MSAPIGHTCNSIDHIIGQIDIALDIINSVISHDPEFGEEREWNDLVEELEKAVSELECIDMEEIRHDNSSLRDWGEDMEIDYYTMDSEKDDAENERDKMEQERDEARIERDDIQDELDKATDRIAELEDGYQMKIAI